MIAGMIVILRIFHRIIPLILPQIGAGTAGGCVMGEVLLWCFSPLRVKPIT
jgi:hypothetical protein